MLLSLSLSLSLCHSTQALDVATLGLGAKASAATVFYFYWAFLAVFAVVFMHVQVATRFLSAASPALWWFVAGLSGRGRTVWVAYALSFTVAGVVLFTTFLPWT